MILDHESWEVCQSRLLNYHNCWMSNSNWGILEYFFCLRISCKTEDILLVRIKNIDVSRRHDCFRLAFHHDANVVNQLQRNIERRVLLVCLNSFQATDWLRWWNCWGRNRSGNNSHKFVNSLIPGRKWPPWPRWSQKYSNYCKYSLFLQWGHPLDLFGL